MKSCRLSKCFAFSTLISCWHSRRSRRYTFFSEAGRIWKKRRPLEFSFLSVSIIIAIMKPQKSNSNDVINKISDGFLSFCLGLFHAIPMSSSFHFKSPKNLSREKFKYTKIVFVDVVQITIGTWNNLFN